MNKMNDRPRIVVVSPLPPWAPGGVQKVVAELCRRLTDVFDINIVTTSKSDDCLGEHLWEDMRVIVFKASASSFFLSVPLYQYLRKEKGIALIHAHNYSTFVPLVSAMAKDHVPLVISPHLHKVGSTKLNSMLRKLYDLSLGPFALKKADILACNSISERNLVTTKFSSLKDKTQVIYNGAPLESIRNAQPFSVDAKVVLCVNRLVKYKNTHLVLQALKHLPEYYEVVVIGSGPEEDNLKELAKNLGVADRTRFFGRLTEAELYSWYHTASVTITLSAIESFGLTCVESLAAGTPVVANDDHGGLKGTIDLFQPNIVAVDVMKDSAEIIARAIEKASRIEVKADLARFSWDYAAKQFAELYVQLIQPNKVKLS